MTFEPRRKIPARIYMTRRMPARHDQPTGTPADHLSEPMPGVFAMCEYIVQHVSPRGFEALFAGTQSHGISDQINSIDDSLHRTFEPRERHNMIKPNMQVNAIRNSSGQLECVKVRWGWSPFWSMGTMPPLTHLPLHLVMRSKVFNRVRRDGRMLIAVDGWYESTEPDMTKTSHRLSYATSRQNAPIFLAALAQASDKFNGCDGLALVTHDDSSTRQQRLLAFTAEDALDWLRPNLEWEQAQDLAMHMAVAEPQLEHVLTSQRSARGR